jgi:hypothetical protein
MFVAYVVIMTQTTNIYLIIVVGTYASRWAPGWAGQASARATTQSAQG